MAFKKGQAKPEGSGRGKGKSNGDTAKLRGLILGALDDAGGQTYLAQQAIEQPAAFLTLVGKVLPKEITGQDGGPFVVQMIERVIVGETQHTDS